MENRGGAVALFELLLPQILMLATLTLQNPKYALAVEAVYLFCLLLVFTEGRNVNRIFQPVRKSAQRVANGTRFVRGGCSVVLPAVGILSNKLSGELFFKDGKMTKSQFVRERKHYRKYLFRKAVERKEAQERYAKQSAEALCWIRKENGGWQCPKCGAMLDAAVHNCQTSGQMLGLPEEN